MGMAKLTKIRSGLYRTAHAGRVIEVERIDEGPADLVGMWSFRIDPDKVGTTTSEARWTRREALSAAVSTAEAMGPRTLLDVITSETEA